MSEFKLILGAHMRSLVGRMGCLDAVAETINARFGASASKGTISRKMNDSLDWAVIDVEAVQSALGAYPVTRLLDQSRIKAEIAGLNRPAHPLEQAASISRETGEAVAAILAAEQSNCAGDLAQAVKETQDAIAALKAANNRMMAELANRSATSPAWR